MEVCCEWNGCASRFTDMNDLSTHCRRHVSEFYPMPCDVYLNETAQRRQAPSGSVHLDCLWKDCEFQATSTVELALHVAFHPQHCVLKAAGLAYQEKHGLSPCSLSSDTRSVIPDIPSPYSCHWHGCQQEFKEPMLYYRHIKEHISATPRVLRPEGEPGVRRYVQCCWEGCSQQKLNRTRLTEHVHSHSGERVIGCPVCGGLFTNATKFNDHLTRQASIDTAYYQCSHCCKRLQSERLLRDHMRQHVNNVHCQLCDMTCPSPSGLRKHMLFKHTSDKPYCCNFCPYRAKTLCDIRRHGETHNEKAAYTCPVDGCSFESKTHAHLRRHYDADHRDDSARPKLYCCQVCHNTYRRGHDLTNHLMRKHLYKHPPSHKRFRYMRGEDGFMYLQLIRFESTTTATTTTAATTTTTAPARADGQPGPGEYHPATGDASGNGGGEQFPLWEGDNAAGTGYEDDHDGMLDDDDDDDDDGGEYEFEDPDGGYEDFSPSALEYGQPHPTASSQAVTESSPGCGDSSAPATVESEDTADGDPAVDERYESAMAMLELISSSQDVLAGGDSDSAADSSSRRLLHGLAQLTGQSIEDVERYLWAPSHPDSAVQADGRQ